MTAFSNKKYLRSILFLFLFCIIQNFSAQTAVPELGAAPGTDEKTISLDAGAAGLPATAKNNEPSSIWILVRIVLVLGIVCGGIYGVVFFLKKTTRINAGNDPYLKNVASLPLSPNKAVQVITIGSQAFVIGVTDQSISLIAEINDRELIDSMNLATDRGNPVPAESFANLLNSFLPKKHGEGQSGSTADGKARRSDSAGGESEAALATTDFLRTQRQRLQQSSIRPENGSGEETDK